MEGTLGAATLSCHRCRKSVDAGLNQCPWCGELFVQMHAGFNRVAILHTAAVNVAAQSLLRSAPEIWDPRTLLPLVRWTIFAGVALVGAAGALYLAVPWAGPQYGYNCIETALVSACASVVAFGFSVLIFACNFLLLKTSEVVASWSLKSSQKAQGLLRAATADETAPSAAAKPTEPPSDWVRVRREAMLSSALPASPPPIKFAPIRLPDVNLRGLADAAASIVAAFK